MMNVISVISKQNMPFCFENRWIKHHHKNPDGPRQVLDKTTYSEVNPWAVYIPVKGCRPNINWIGANLELHYQPSLCS